MKYYSEEDYRNSEFLTQSSSEVEFGCGYCWDNRRKREKEIFFLDNANNMRVCSYCPYCGRALNK